MALSKGGVSGSAATPTPVKQAPAAPQGGSENITLTAEDFGNLIPGVPEGASIGKPTQAEESEAQPEHNTPPSAPEGAGEGESDEPEQDGATDAGEGEDAPAADPEPKPEEEEDHEARGWPESARKRVSKITAQKKEAQAKLEAAQKEAEAAKATAAELRSKLEQGLPMAQATEENPLADAMSPQDVQAAAERARKIKTWALRNLEGATVTDKEGNETFIEAEKVREHLAKADDILSHHVPARLQYLQLRAHADQEASKAYPAMFDKSTPDYQALQTALRQFPELQRVPNVALIIGDALRGQALRKAEAEKARKPAAAAAKPAAPAPKVNRGAPPPRGSGSNTSEAHKRLAEGGGREADIAELVESVL